MITRASSSTCTSGEAMCGVVISLMKSCEILIPREAKRSSNNCFSSAGRTSFEKGPLLFNRNMRHAALLLRGKTLFVFWTQVADTPERILLSTIDVSGDWIAWRASVAVEVLRPERPWEGAGAPRIPSVRSTAYGQVNQLRDPAIYLEDGKIYILYAVAGESGIAIAQVTIKE